MTNDDILKENFRQFRMRNDERMAQKYVAQENGKGLSTNDFTDAYKNKVDSLTSGGGSDGVDLSTKVTLQSGFAVPNSVAADFGNRDTLTFGNYSSIDCGTHASIHASYADITVTGANFYGKPTFNSGFKTADSISSAFGNYDTINIGNYSKVSIDNNSTVVADHSYVNLMASEMKLTNSTITGDATFKDKITLSGGSKTADSVSSAFGNYNTISAGKKSNIIFGKNSTLDARYSNVNLKNGTITFDNDSAIEGKVSFFDAPIFTNGIKFFPHSATINDIRFDATNNLLCFTIGDAVYSLPCGLAGGTISPNLAISDWVSYPNADGAGQSLFICNISRNGDGDVVSRAPRVFVSSHKDMAFYLTSMTGITLPSWYDSTSETKLMAHCLTDTGGQSGNLVVEDTATYSSAAIAIIVPTVSN